MSDTSGINATINANIFTNNAGKITAAVVVSVLTAITAWVAVTFAGLTSPTQAAIPATHFLSTVTGFYINGYSAVGDFGAGCQFVKGTSNGPAAIADADGTYWQLGGLSINRVSCWGAKGDNSTNDNPAVRAALAYLGTAGGGTLSFPWGTNGKYILDATQDTVGSYITISCDSGVMLKPQASAAVTMFYFNGSYGGLNNCYFLGNSGAPVANTPVVVESASGGQVIADNHIVGFSSAMKMPRGNAVKLSRNRIEYCGTGTCVSVGGVTNEYFGDATWEDNVVLPNSGTAIGVLFDGGTNAQYVHRLEVNGGGIGLQIQFAGGPANPQNIWCWDCNIDAAATEELNLIACWTCEFHATNLSGTTAGPGVLINASSGGTIDGISFNAVQVQGNSAQGIYLQSGRNVKIVGGVIADNSAGSAGTYSGVQIGANARGLVMIQDAMMGLSAAGTTGWGHNLNAQKYAIQLDAGCLTNASPDTVNGYLVVTGNFFTGNTTGTLNGTCSGATASTTTPNY